MRQLAALVGVRHARFATAQGRKNVTQRSERSHKTKFAWNSTNTTTIRGPVNSSSQLPVITSILVTAFPQL